MVRFGRTVRSRTVAALWRGLGAVEWAGNKLPHPFWLFWILAVLLALLSGLLSWFDVSATSPVDGEVIRIRSMLSTDAVRMVLTSAVDNFVEFPPLGLVLVITIGVAVADGSGLLAASVRFGLGRVRPRMVTFAVAFASMFGHVMSDAAYMVLLPLAPAMFRAVGRSPVLGVVVGFVSFSAARDASPLITPGDALLSGITTEAAQTLHSDLVVTPVANYFFSLASSIVLAATITLVAEKFLAPRVAADDAADPNTDDGEGVELTLRADERRGVLRAAGVLGAMVVVVAAVAAPQGSPLRGEGGSLVESPLMDGIVVLLALAFLVTGVVYGWTTGSVRRGRDVPDLIAGGLRSIAPLVVMFFAASQYLAYFDWTGLGPVIAIRSAELLQSLGVATPLLFVGLLLLVTVVNFFITSGSAQWTLVAPIFVPMFLLLDIPAETTQALYRIADSATNPMTPMNAFFVVALGFMQRYRSSAGVGTLMALTIPLCLTVLVVWSAFFLLWWALGIPLGPGAPVR